MTAWDCLCAAFREATTDAPNGPPALAAMIATARAERPTLALDECGFARHVGQRLDAGERPSDVLPRLFAGELWLAYGCTVADAKAVAVFDAEYVAPLDAQLARGDALAAFRDDVKQDVRVRLLAPRDGQEPRIALYRGRGPLAAWLRMTAARAAIEIHRHSGARHDAAEVPNLADAAADPELRFLKTHYVDQLGAAMAQTLARLPSEDALLLRLYFLEGLPSETIAKMNGVSSRTVQRRIVQIRSLIRAQVRTQLDAQLGLSETQLTSLIRLVDDELHISVARLLNRTT